MSAPPSAPPRSLARTLGLRDLVLIVVGTVIGSGIFTVPGRVLNATQGDVGVALLVWLGGGVLSLLGALTFGGISTGVSSARRPPSYRWAAGDFARHEARARRVAAYQGVR